MLLNINYLQYKTILKKDNNSAVAVILTQIHLCLLKICLVFTLKIDKLVAVFKWKF